MDRGSTGNRVNRGGPPILWVSRLAFSVQEKNGNDDGGKKASLTYSGKIFEKPGLITLAVQHLMERNKDEGCGELNRS